MAVYSPKAHRSSIFNRGTNSDLDSWQCLSLRDPTFLSTLPFDQNNVRRDITERALSRTQRGWAWYDQAQKLNPLLGTLFRLPPEIRCRIWDCLLQCRSTLSNDGLWEYVHHYGPVFNLGAYCFGFGRRLFIDNPARSLRLVSSSVRNEFDDVFLSTRIFRFNRPEDLAHFCNRLTGAQTCRLHSIAIGIYPMFYMTPWIDAVRKLPSELKEIQILIYPVFSSNWYEESDGQEALKSLSEIVKIATLKCPNARFSFHSTNQQPLPPQCQKSLGAASKMPSDPRSNNAACVGSGEKAPIPNITIQDLNAWLYVESNP